MINRLTNIACLMVLLPGIAQAGSPDKIQGNWLGEWTGQGGMGGKNVAEIRGLGNGEYQATFTAFDSGEQDMGVFTFAINGSSVGEDKVEFTQDINLGLLGSFHFEATVEQGKLRGKYTNGNIYQGTLELERIEKQPEQVGAKPLPGAVMLFDGSSLNQWTLPAAQPAEWLIKDGVLTLQPTDSASRSAVGHLVAKPEFTAAQIHLEFRLPYLPDKRGEERANGGVYLGGQYELQIVDSFGFPRPRTLDGDFEDHDALGAIYKQRPPLEMAALPPGEWQAFDITFTGPKTDSSGQSQPAEVTVMLNGTLIHDRVPLTEPTEGAPGTSRTTKSGLILQNAGQLLEFRNIWYVPLDVPATR